MEFTLHHRFPDHVRTLQENGRMLEYLGDTKRHPNQYDKNDWIEPTKP